MVAILFTAMLSGLSSGQVLVSFCTFIRGHNLYILLSDALTPTQLGRARDLLLTFYKDFQSLYGKKF